MPHKTAHVTATYGIGPLSFLITLAFVVMLVAKVLLGVSISWLVVLSPVLVWVVMVGSASLLVIIIISFLSLALALRGKP